jgi:hypothetical protein
VILLHTNIVDGGAIRAAAVMGSDSVRSLCQGQGVGLASKACTCYERDWSTKDMYLSAKASRKSVSTFGTDATLLPCVLFHQVSLSANSSHKKHKAPRDAYLLCVAGSSMYTACFTQHARCFRCFCIREALCNESDEHTAQALRVVLYLSKQRTTGWQLYLAKRSLHRTHLCSCRMCPAHTPDVSHLVS